MKKIMLMVFLFSLSGSIFAGDENPVVPSQSSVSSPDFEKMMQDAKNRDGSVTPTSKNQFDDVAKSKSVETVSEKKPEEVITRKEEELPVATQTTVVVNEDDIRNQKIISTVIGVVLLTINFICSIFLPHYRYAFINTPGDLGVKEEKNEAQAAVQVKRNTIEIILLVCAVGLYYFGAFKSNDTFHDLTKNFNNNLAVTVVNSTLVFLSLYGAYIGGRLLIGFKTRCPSCKNMFAAKCVHSYEEANSHYTKKLGNTYHTREVGVRHMDYVCTVCEHEWHVAKKYDKRV